MLRLKIKDILSKIAKKESVMKKLLLFFIFMLCGALNAMETTKNVIIQTSEGPLSIDLTSKQYESLLDHSRFITAIGNMDATEEEIEELAKTFSYQHLSKLQVQEMIESSPATVREITVVTADGSVKNTLSESELNALAYLSVTLKELFEDMGAEKIGDTLQVPGLTKKQWNVIVQYLPILEQYSTDRFIGQAKLEEKVTNTKLAEIIDLLNASDYLNIPVFYDTLMAFLVNKYLPAGYNFAPSFTDEESTLLQENLNPNGYQDLQDALNKRKKENLAGVVGG